jgi:hypothetical protein
MRLDVDIEAAPEQWDALVTDLGGTVFHTTCWARYRVAGEPNATPVFYRLVSDAGEPLGVALGFRFRSEHRLLSGLSGQLAFDAMPAVSGAEAGALEGFIEHIEADARAHHDASLVLGSFASPGRAEVLEACGYEVTPRMEFEMDLTRAEDDLWTAMEHKRRKNIKKAGRKNVTLTEPAAAEAVDHLRRLQGESSRRIVERGGPDITFEGDETGDPVAVLLHGGVARLVCAWVDGQVESAGLFTAFNGLVYHTLSGHSRAGLKAQAPTLLLWETLKRYKGEGMTRLNLGGCSADAVNEDSPEHGVYRYKRDWGGEALACASGRKVLRPVAHGLVKTVRKALGR